MRRFPSFVLLVVFSFFASLRAQAEPLELMLAPGEIRFDGSVTAVNLSGANPTITISVASFTLPSGNSSKLQPPKPKTVLVKEARVITLDDEGRALKTSDLKAGVKVVVLGRDAGSGKDVPARVIGAAVQPMPGASTAIDDQTTADDADDKNELKVRAGETRYDGKITGVLSADVFTVSVVSTTSAAGATNELMEPQVKNIQASDETLIRSREDANRKLTMADLKIGLRVSLVGKDAGAKTIKAREVAVWDDNSGRTRSLGSVSVNMQTALLLAKGDESQRAHSLEDALKSYNAALQAAMNANDEPGQAMSHNRLALLYGDLGQPKRALEGFNKALEIWRRARNTNSEATTYLNLAGHYQRTNDMKNARTAIESAIRLFGNSGNSKALAIAYSRLGRIQSEQGEMEAAIASWQQALGLARQSQERDEEINVLGHLSVGYAKTNQTDKAQEVIGQLVALLPNIADKDDQAMSNYLIGIAYKDLNNKDQARTYLTQAVNLWNIAGQRDAATAAQKQISKLEAAPEPQQEQPAEGAIVPAG